MGNEDNQKLVGISFAVGIESRQLVMIKEPIIIVGWTEGEQAELAKSLTLDPSAVSTRLDGCEITNKSFGRNEEVPEENLGPSLNQCQISSPTPLNPFE